MYFSLLNFIFFKKKLSSIGFTAQFDKKSNLELKSTQRCWSTFLPFYAYRVNRKQFRHGYLTIGLGPNRFILICRIESKIRKRFWFARFFVCDSLWRIILIFILIHFDSLSRRSIRNDLFWLTLIHNSFGFLFILINDSIWFYSFWFALILIRCESRFTRESKSNRIKNQRKVYRIKSESKWIANRAGPSPAWQLTSRDTVSKILRKEHAGKNRQYWRKIDNDNSVSKILNFQGQIN